MLTVVLMVPLVEDGERNISGDSGRSLDLNDSDGGGSCNGGGGALNTDVV